jgi:hypothetical protein
MSLVILYNIIELIMSLWIENLEDGHRTYNWELLWLVDFAYKREINGKYTFDLIMLLLVWNVINVCDEFEVYMIMLIFVEYKIVVNIKWDVTTYS